jgi:drug/metabolite transporter (DMT)-like permease
MLFFLIVLLAAFCFCFQNVIVRVLFTSQTVLGLFPLGGYVTPTLQHSFLLLVLRMVWVVPVVGVLAPKLYAPMWPTMRQLPQRRSLLQGATAAGGLMFLYLALLYVAIGLIPTGVALTLFFTYPAFTALFSWKLFGAAPTPTGWVVMLLIFLGSMLTMPPVQLDLASSNFLGIVLGVASGVAYAGYSVVAQKSFTQMHPIPFTWLSFLITLVLAMLAYGIGQWLWPAPTESLPWAELWIGGLCSAIATASGHLLNNLGISRIGATAAAMVASTNPAFTVVLAWFTIQETLSGVQLSGVGLVTLSVVLLSQEYRK